MCGMREREEIRIVSGGVWLVGGMRCYCLRRGRLGVVDLGESLEFDVG